MMTSSTVCPAPNANKVHISGNKWACAIAKGWNQLYAARNFDGIASEQECLQLDQLTGVCSDLILNWDTEESQNLVDVVSECASATLTLAKVKTLPWNPGDDNYFDLTCFRA